MHLAIIFPFGITVYILCILLQVILGARKGYMGAAIIVGLYLIGGLAFCLASRTLNDFFYTIIFALIQCIIFITSRIIFKAE